MSLGIRKYSAPVGKSAVYLRAPVGEPTAPDFEAMRSHTCPDCGLIYFTEKPECPRCEFKQAMADWRDAGYPTIGATNPHPTIVALLPLYRDMVRSGWL